MKLLDLCKIYNNIYASLSHCRWLISGLKKERASNLPDVELKQLVNDVCVAALDCSFRTDWVQMKSFYEWDCFQSDSGVKVI